MLTGGQVFMAPAGTPFDGTPDKWEHLGYVSKDGFDLDQIDAESWHRANPPIWAAPRVRRSFSLTMTGHDLRRFNRLIWGIYRARGDKPLINNGKKHR